jgi:carboxymethylenebutenolidase
VCEEVRIDTQDIERIWDAHVEAEFETKDLETTLATMTDDASVMHVPVGTGGRGKDELRRFYGEDFIGSWPDDLETTAVSRTVGETSLVDELHMIFTHSNRMEWLLPGVAPTGRRIEVVFVAVIEFRGALLRSERIYWDHASVLRQAGLL